MGVGKVRAKSIGSRSDDDKVAAELVKARSNDEFSLVFLGLLDSCSLQLPGLVLELQ